MISQHRHSSRTRQWETMCVGMDGVMIRQTVALELDV